MFLALLPLVLADDVCPAGQQAPPNAAEACCWPAQVWDKRAGSCLGTPQCPSGLRAEGATCVASEAAPPPEPEPNAGLLGAMGDPGDMGDLFGDAPYEEDLTGGVGGLIGARSTIEVQALEGGTGGVGGGGDASAVGGTSSGSLGGDPIILGALDRAHIDGVVRAHTGALRNCYERGLAADPTLAGKVVVKFVIAKDGTVSSATTKSSTLAAPAVEACLNEAFMGFGFDAPAGGGIVIVSYPFVFTPG